MVLQPLYWSALLPKFTIICDEMLKISRKTLTTLLNINNISVNKFLNSVKHSEVKFSVIKFEVYAANAIKRFCLIIIGWKSDQITFKWLKNWGKSGENRINWWGLFFSLVNTCLSLIHLNWHFFFTVYWNWAHFYNSLTFSPFPSRF